MHENVQILASNFEKRFISHFGRGHSSSPDHAVRCRIKGVLGALQHPDPQSWEPAIGGTGKFLCAS